MAWVDTKLPVNSKVIYGFETSLKSALEHPIKKIPALEKLQLNLRWAQIKWQNSRYENIYM